MPSPITLYFDQPLFSGNSSASRVEVFVDRDNDGFETITVGQEPQENEETVDLYNKMIDFESSHHLRHLHLTKL
jgi:hypothetical protein